MLTWLDPGKNKTVTGGQSIFNHSVNTYSITNSKFQGINALQHLKYQDLKLKQFPRKYEGMKIGLQVISPHHVTPR